MRMEWIKHKSVRKQKLKKVKQVTEKNIWQGISNNTLYTTDIYHYHKSSLIMK